MSHKILFLWILNMVRKIFGVFRGKKQIKVEPKIKPAPEVSQKARIDNNGIVVNIEPKPKIDSNVVIPNNNANEKPKVKFKGKMSMKAAK